jgi:hypothetical protein
MRDPIITPELSVHVSVRDAIAALDDLARDLTRDCNSAALISRRDDIREIAAKAADLVQAIDRRAWAKGITAGARNAHC